MAVVVETKELLETVVASVVAGVGITVDLLGRDLGRRPLRRPQPQRAARSPPGRRRRWRPSPVLATLAAVAFGIVVMTSK